MAHDDAAPRGSKAEASELRRLRSRWRVVLAGLGACLSVSTCGDDDGPSSTACTTSTECSADRVCIDGVCVARGDTGPDPCGPMGCDCSLFGPDTCGPGRRCFEGHCVTDPSTTDAGPDVGPDAGPDLGPCGPGDVCQDDARCIDGRCRPWGMGTFDDACERSATPGPIRPQLQCEWSGSAEDDPYPGERAVLHTPLVANLGIVMDPDVPPRPNVIVVSDASYMESVPRVCQASGTVRVLDGATCRELGAATDPDARVNSSVTPAIGDLDGAGAPEIVSAAADGGLVALRWDAAMGRLVRLWSSTMADGSPDTFGSTRCLWGGISLADLDDDGRPEIVFDGGVWSPDGVFLSAIPGWAGFPHGVPAPVADVDGDGIVEVVGAEATWQWDAASASFVREAFSTDSGARGFTAIADFGDFPGMAGDVAGAAEVVVAAGGMLWVQTIGGAILSSYAAPSAVGGPPTIADYDGDGLPEVGAAYADHYVVFDIGTGAVLWQQPSQDRSSARTGSSVFDFNGDGRAEVVYGDECYVRIYDGTGGEVLFSQARFSSTWTENPIVADVDADSAAEVVMGTSGPCAPTYCPMIDPIFAGLRCDAAGDCPGGSCVEGLCRCATDADCGATYGCVEPIAGTPGAGNVCRARHLDCEPGLRVYRDARDRWAASRAIWNQHAYSVTNVLDDGRVPRTSEARANWREPGLNNFRQNVQGGLVGVPGADLTLGRLRATCEGDATRLVADVCNRGGALVDAGVEVIFRQEGGEELCRLRTTEPVSGGRCTPVSCLAPVRADGVFEGVVDPDAIIAECDEDNGTARGEADCLL